MTRTRVRLIILCEWLGFWLLTTVIAACAPLIRKDGAIGGEQLMPALLSISSIWVPPVTLFVSFWFPTGDAAARRGRSVGAERALVAIALNTVYMLLITFLTVWTMYLAEYDFDADVLPEGASFLERLGAMVRYALLLSPLALVPIRWLNYQSAPAMETSP